MLGDFRGLPLVMVIFLTLLNACSENAQFVDKGFTNPEGTSGDLEGKSCDAATAGGETKCLIKREQLAVEPNEATLRVGEVKEFKAFLIFPNGEKKDVTNQANWSALPRSSVRVNGQGAAFVLAPGSLSIDAVYGDLKGTAVITALGIDVPVDPFVIVKVNSFDGDLAVPVGTPVKIDWTTQDVVSCQLFVGGKEIDRRIGGSSEVRVSESTSIEAICKTDRGEDVRDYVDVTVTKPTVTLTANGSTEDLTVIAGRSVDLKWSSANAKSCSLRADGAELGQGLDGELSLNVVKGQTIQASCVDAAGNAAVVSLNVSLNYESRFVFSPGHRDKIDGLTASRPVSIVFALDVTGSMSSQIGTVKSNIVSFVSELTKRDFKPMLGVVPFRDKVPRPGELGDVPEGRLDLTFDAESVKSFVSTLRALNGGDANEASLGAIQESVAMLRAGDTRPDAIKIVMLITDQPGHNGQVTTDCDLTPTINQFAGLTDSEQQSFKLFYSVPKIGAACSGFASGEAQMTALISKILNAEPLVEKRGGLIPWPFTQVNLVQDVVNMLVKVTPAIDLACIDRDVRVSLNGSPFMSWTPPDPNYVFAQLEAEGAVSISRTLSDAEHAAFAAGGGKMVIDRCCVSRAAALAGEYGTCLKSVTMNDVPFTLEDH